VYDRFGFHKEFLTEFLHHPGFHYHPYTGRYSSRFSSQTFGLKWLFDLAFQLANPNKYNEEYAAKQVTVLIFLSVVGM
jgi:hypothetical protein